MLFRSTSTATAVASHLGQTRVDLLLGLAKNLHKITSLLGVWKHVSSNPNKGEKADSLSVVNRVMAVP